MDGLGGAWGYWLNRLCSRVFKEELMCCQEASLLGWLGRPGRGVLQHSFPCLCLLCYLTVIYTWKYRLSVPGYCVGVLRKGSKHSLGLGSDWEVMAVQPLLSTVLCGEQRFPCSPGGITPSPQWQNLLFHNSRSHSPRLAPPHTVALESTFHSEILMFKHFCSLWKNAFHYFLFVRGLWWTWSITSKASSKSWECFCSLETSYYFIPIGEMLTLLFETSQNTAVLTFGKYHYVEILHCMAKKINLSIFLKPPCLNFAT